MVVKKDKYYGNEKEQGIEDPRMGMGQQIAIIKKLCIQKMTFEQRLEGVQELSHVGYLAEEHFRPREHFRNGLTLGGTDGFQKQQSFSGEE